MNGRDEIEKSALALPEADRADVARALLDSLEHDAEPEIDAAWAEGVARRLHRIESGRAKLVPSDEAFTRARRRLTR